MDVEQQARLLCVNRMTEIESIVSTLRLNQGQNTSNVRVLVKQALDILRKTSFYDGKHAEKPANVSLDGTIKAENKRPR